jgi:fructokinase
MSKPTIVCFGEMLWDMLPSGKQAGGAPMNVAVQLKNLGLNPLMISRVGEDELGEELLAFLQERGLSPDLVQQGKTHLTGIVKANITDQNEVVYKIVHPVAWDYIQPEGALLTIAATSDVFVFGSLVARSVDTRQTLLHLLEKAPFKVFDVNLRSPFYDQAGIEELLYKADMVKMNEHELALIASWSGLSNVLESAIEGIAARFDIATICVTLGAEGAMLWKNNTFYRNAGFKVVVNDTIGSGDAFLAGLLSHLTQGKTPEESLQFACAMGSLVATHQGATPVISSEQVNQMISPV